MSILQKGKSNKKNPDAFSDKGYEKSLRNMYGTYNSLPYAMIGN